MTTSRDTGTQHKLRMPPELKEKLFESAKDMNRSLNAEIVARLEESFDELDDDYEDALSYASLAVAKTLNEKGVDWSEIQQTVISMLAKAREYKKAP